MEKQVKKFVPCIWLKNGRAVKSPEDARGIGEDPDDIAREYEESLADAIIVADISDDTKMRAETIRVMRDICSAVRIPVIGMGQIVSVEDAKDIIYAGCQMAVMDFGKGGAASCAAASEKFGRGRIGAFCHAAEELSEYSDIIKKYAPCVFLPKEELKGAEAAIRNLLPNVPVVVNIEDDSKKAQGEEKNLEEKNSKEEPEDTRDGILSALLADTVTAVTGGAVNKSAGRIRVFKKLCLEKDIPVETRQAVFSWSDLKKDASGLVPVVVQEAYTDKVLMVAYMDENAYNKTIETGKMTYFSRSRQKEWVKGETSGHFQYVRSLTCDCDLDTILARVDQIGAACHTGHHSCFFNTDIVMNRLEKHSPRTILETDYETIQDRMKHPKKGSYTNSLLDRGLDGMLEKLLEENAELLIAAKNGIKSDTVDEIADCLYHLMVVMAHENITWKDVTEELSKRAKDEETDADGE